MKTDRITKVLLAAIATALWMIALNPWLRPMPVAAQDFSGVETYLAMIQSDVSSVGTDLRRIARGVCTNSKIC